MKPTPLRLSRTAVHCVWSPLLAALLVTLGGCATVSIDTQPRGADLYYNGRFLGKSPLAPTFSLFEYSMGVGEAVLPGYKREDPPLAPRPGTVLWISSPSGARVYKNGMVIGTTPMYDTEAYLHSVKYIWPNEILERAKGVSDEDSRRPETVVGTSARPPRREEPFRVRDPLRKRLAVVIGISDYKHRGKWNLTNLRYAARDAQALAGWLGDSQGGRFDEVHLLTDADATTRNVKIALREKLRSVQRDDMVLVFWAGHGTPDPHDLRALYLLTHDADPEHLPATAYAMDEFKADIGKLRSERVLLVADACHSAGISDPKIGVRGIEENKMVEGLRGITVAPTVTSDGGSAGPMRMIFTSCETNELSRENADLGGGHGVFTYHLLEGLRGEADRRANWGNGDGNVTLGELVEYTRDAVKRATGNQQHPDTAGRFDRNLLMGVVR